MTKSQLIGKVADRTGTTKRTATMIVESVFDVIEEALAEGENVQLVGFGHFEVRERETREGRNPQTGESLMIAGGKYPAFKPGKTLKEVVKQGA